MKSILSEKVLLYAAAFVLVYIFYTRVNGKSKSADSAKETTMSDSKASKSIYDYSFTTLDGKTVKLSDYKGKKILFVNTASECGYTPQYAGLEELYKKYKDKMVILGFPSNQFGKQEPGTSEEIKSFCTKNYGVDFPMSQKIEVKGDNKDAIYHWLTQKELNGKMDSEVKWNFQKYLVDEKGNFVDMYLSAVKPDDPKLIAAIEK